jgi:long-chain acyl-CoA synthetase
MGRAYESPPALATRQPGRHTDPGSDRVPVTTLNELIDQAVTERPRRDMFRVKRDGRWIDVSSQEFALGVCEMAAGLRALGLQPGDRVVLLSENRLEWATADAAILRCGAVTVPIYPSLLREQVAFIVGNSDPTLAIGSTPAQMEKLRAAAGRAASLRHLLCIDADPGQSCLMLASVREQGRQRLGAQPDLGAPARVGADDLATVVYTSGTTGDPKGVMLTHGNIVENLRACLEVFSIGPQDVTLSFLPLSHIFERMAGHYTMIHAGVGIAYAESIDALPANLAEIRPTVMTGVPRVYEKMYARVLGAALAGGPARRMVFLWCKRSATAWARARIAGRRPGALAALGHRVGDALVFSKLRERTGGRVRFFISGSAPLAREIIEFFYAAGLPILEGYGLTETAPVIALNTFEHYRPGSVGRPIPRVEVGIAGDGEILTRSRCVMKGYYRNPQATAEALGPGGWFHTGDIGHLDRDGFLHITDRKKDLIKTSGGKFVAPQPIENELRTTRYISEVTVVGDGRKYVVALIVPNFENLRQYAGRHQLAVDDLPALLRHGQVLGLYGHLVDKVNARLPGFEQVKKFRLLDHEFSAERGELTPSLKVRRRVIAQRYHDEIEALYAEGTGGAAP